MRIDKKLNLVYTVEREDGEVLYIHSTPLGRMVFEKYYMVIARAFSRVYGGGLSHVAGPSVAAYLLKDTALAMEAWDGLDGVEQGLMNEIIRNSKVIAPSPTGWAPMPLDTAISREVFSEDERAEFLNAICFFILASCVHRRSMLASHLAAMNGLWGTQTTLLGYTDFVSSLPISTGTVSSKMAGLQVPS